jgi:hypothetical protein
MDYPKSFGMMDFHMKWGMIGFDGGPDFRIRDKV